MEIKPNKEIVPAPIAAPRARVERPAEQAAEDLSFETTRSLDAALAAIPDVRPEVVERARDLVNLIQYPPAETMHKLARLLALELRKDSE